MRNPEREATFEFSSRLADASFRAILRDHGCSQVQDVVVTLDDTPVVDVLDRVFTKTRSPALVAVRRPTEDLGFVFLVVKADAGPSKEPSTVPRDVESLSDHTTIGMLYDTIPTAHGATFAIGRHFRYSFESVGPELIGA
ncbi:hypothetical protein KRMM14A1259_18440 [Krasilnikovia sp. MM14-A1259]